MDKLKIVYDPQGYPLIPCHQEGPHLIFSVPCPYCGLRHYHGAGGGFGHRAAHCPSLAPGIPAPGSSKGYVLVSH